MNRSEYVWSPDEDAILKQHVASLGLVGLAKSGLLPKRTYGGIKHRCIHFGLDVTHKRNGGGRKQDPNEGERWPLPTHYPHEVAANRLFGEWLRAA